MPEGKEGVLVLERARNPVIGDGGNDVEEEVVLEIITSYPRRLNHRDAGPGVNVLAIHHHQHVLTRNCPMRPPAQ